VTGTIDVRSYEEDDRPAVLDLLAASLGWVPDDQHARFFTWKHRDNPFGPSPAWVATDAGAGAGGRIVGFRTFLRWELELDGRPIRAVRAVDTATHPDHQGRGIFTRLTRDALDGLREDGVELVFNTPNERSRPGYLKLGWQPIARLPVLARPRSPAALVRLARARTPAAKWSVASDAGRPAADVLADEASVARLLASVPRDGLRTRRSPRQLAWRYGFEPMAYRAVTVDAGVAGGVVVFRLRRRGPALEAAICDELVPAGDPELTRRLLREVLRTSGADHAVRLGSAGGPRAGFVPVPRQGPTLVGRPVSATDLPDPARWRLSLGDVELF
jgi:GNAT superfamily N-acetyltransferase